MYMFEVPQVAELWTVNWKTFGMKRSWPIWSLCTIFFLEGLGLPKSLPVELVSWVGFESGTSQKRVSGVNRSTSAFYVNYTKMFMYHVTTSQLDYDCSNVTH